MADISNKTLALLVGVALVVSLIGLVSGPNLITGRATDSGTATLDVQGVSAIDVVAPDNAIDFLAGSIQNSGPCVLESNGSEKSADCLGGWLSGTVDNFIINNSGSVDINVTLSSDKDAGDFVTGTGPAFAFQSDEGNCTTNAISGFGTSIAANNSEASSEYAVCDFLAPGEGFNVSLTVSIPIDADTGSRVATLTFTGLQV